MHVSILPQTPLPLPFRLSHNVEQSSLCYTVGPCWLSILNIEMCSVQLSSVAQSCPTLWDPMDCSTPGFPVHHQLPELTQTHVHQEGAPIQSSRPLSSPLLLPTMFPSIRVFSGESVQHQVVLCTWHIISGLNSLPLDSIIPVLNIFVSL